VQLTYPRGQTNEASSPSTRRGSLLASQGDDDRRAEPGQSPPLRAPRAPRHRALRRPTASFLPTRVSCTTPRLNRGATSPRGPHGRNLMRACRAWERNGAPFFFFFGRCGMGRRWWPSAGELDPAATAGGVMITLRLRPACVPPPFLFPFVVRAFCVNNFLKMGFFYVFARAHPSGRAAGRDLLRRAALPGMDVW
jgi:hypothetical protein